MATVHVTKYSGETEEYDESKLRKSLNSAGADPLLIDHIAQEIRKTLHEGISTQKIYKDAFRLLKSESQQSAGRYKLKEALFELGPSGYPFERFVAELLSRLGYKTEIGVVVKGDCVSHEIDVIAQTDSSYLLVECKFHNRNENRCNVKVPLYIQSRFQDVKRNWSSLPGHKSKTHKGWVVTNTRFTSDAEKYGNCVGLKLLSWDYPKKNGIKDQVARLNLHPVTCLSSLTKDEKSRMLKHDIVFCRQICEDKNRLREVGINPRNINKIAKEAVEICNHRENHDEPTR
ncbi:restriction endonuclease [Rhodohalobacter halophilus]|uniref:restriction endonuclease n=1 Tax=Rhodohalobacter halophilus TaxID=1812810 RepID=UPI00083F51A6|nr:restriction endonuclease [Rhodohalobacter halophilus]